MKWNNYEEEIKKKKEKEPNQSDKDRRLKTIKHQKSLYPMRKMSLKVY